MEGKTNGISITVKKGLSILIILSVFISCIVGSASANEFTLHSGVAFGMTEDEVRTLEKKAGFDLVDYSGVNDYGSNKISKKKEVKGQIAGISDSTIHYMFDKGGKLTACTYILGDMFTDLEPNYSTIENALIKKYGEPSELWLPIAERIGFEPLLYINSWGMGFKSLPENSSWLIEQDDGSYVLISHYKGTVSMYSLPFNFHIIGYQCYSHDEFESEIDALSNEADIITEQRNNDI